MGYLHIDGCESSVGDGTADGTGKGESRVEVDTAELLWGTLGLDSLLDGVQLAGASRGGWCCRCVAHCDGCDVIIRGLL